MLHPLIVACLTDLIRSLPCDFVSAMREKNCDGGCHDGGVIWGRGVEKMSRKCEKLGLELGQSDLDSRITRGGKG
jgi:hypothetical protein